MMYYIKRKCGADFRLSEKRLWNAQLKINDYKTPHLDSMGMCKEYALPHSYTRNECCRYPFSCEIFQISFQG